LTGYCGPKAFQTLAAAGIKVANDASGTVAEALADYKSGKLVYADGANADAHW
jgi:predicted Fe-Mo cluster-binding NifX family protein